ncbi:hypothetical protein [Thalassotalea agariperforans]
MYYIKRSKELQSVNNLQTVQSKWRLTHLIETVLSSNGGYYADRLYSFQRPDKLNVILQPIENLKLPRISWLVLGREHYFETSKEYPISNKRELKKALQFEENKAPFQGITLQHIERLNEQSHRVTFWVFKTSVLDILSSQPWVVIPESYLLAKALDSGISLAEIESFNKTIFLSKTGQGVASGIQSVQTSTVEQFAFSTGSPVSLTKENFFSSANNEFSALLYRGLKSLALVELQNFFITRKKVNWQDYPWKQAGIITSIVFSVYLAITSAWLILKQYHIEGQLTSQKVQVEQALKLQKQYIEQKEWLQALSKPLLNQVEYWNVWPIVLETISVGVNIKLLQFKNNKIIMSAITNDSIKATDVLANLSKNPYVIAPGFSTPVRNHRGKDEFTITFSLAKTVLESAYHPTITTNIVSAQGGNYASSK